MSTAYEQALDRARAYRKDRDFVEFENLFCEDIGLPSTQAMWDWIEKYADKKSAEALVAAGVNLPLNIQPASQDEPAT